MMRSTSLPIRLRLTIAFAAGLAMVVVALSAFVYISAGTDLLDTVDTGLSSRAELLAGDLQRDGPTLVNVVQSLIDSDRVFAQIANSSGGILQSTASISRWRLLPAATIRSLDETAYYDRQIPVVDNVTRVLAFPVKTPQGRFVVMVGASLQDRQDELDQLRTSLAFGGSIAIVIISVGAWLVLGGALRPVERMRREAAAISASDPRRRLSPSRGRDEMSSLGATLNQMLDRIEESVDRERRLVDRASHELRTPLAIQRMDVDLALSGPQTVIELAAALRSVSAENAHLTRLTEDLLVLARARGGVLPVRRVETSLPDLLAEACRRDSLLAGAVEVSFRAGSERAMLDPVWFRQVIHNLVDNAVRHTPAGRRVDVSAARRDGTIVFMVEDTGPGFAEAELRTVFEPFAVGGGNGAPSGATASGATASGATASGATASGATASGATASGATANGRESTGLGLAVVRLIAEAHGGSARAENRPSGGARITITIPDESGGPDAGNAR
jgi:signal transduction histidine kinase